MRKFFTTFKYALITAFCLCLFIKSAFYLFFFIILYHFSKIFIISQRLLTFKMWPEFSLFELLFFDYQLLPRFDHEKCRIFSQNSQETFSPF